MGNKLVFFSVCLKENISYIHDILCIYRVMPVVYFVILGIYFMYV